MQLSAALAFVAAAVLSIVAQAAPTDPFSQGPKPYPDPLPLPTNTSLNNSENGTQSMAQQAELQEPGHCAHPMKFTLCIYLTIFGHRMCYNKHCIERDAHVLNETDFDSSSLSFDAIDDGEHKEGENLESTSVVVVERREDLTPQGRHCHSFKLLVCRFWHYFDPEDKEECRQKYCPG